MKHNRLKKQKIKLQCRIKPIEINMSNKGNGAGSFLLGMTFSLILASTQSFANPVEGRVVAGSATINQTSPGRLDIVQSSNKAIIDWKGFSIQNGEHTHFQQPDVSSMALNRVTGSQLSAIHGSLTANGRVLLVNPNGVLFGKNSKVNVGSLIATTSDINNDDFMAGSFTFDKESNNLDATILNRGRIEVTEGGAVVLAAPSVVNEGLINARLGQVVLAGTESFTIDFTGDGLLQFELGKKSQTEPSANQSNNIPVSNSGTILADGGIVQMTNNVANTVVDHVINMDGVIQARSVDVHNGTIILSGGETGIVAVSGTLDVSGAEPGQVGGVVKVLGDKVGLFDGTDINASGDTGGGTVLVGGNYQGKGEEPRASRTMVAENTVINADAHTDGDGGTVVLWSDEVTVFSGEISARGGLNGGDGGSVEVSGKQDLIFRGQVDLNSAHGSNGSLLLDPLDIEITSQPDENNDNELDDNQILAGDSPGATFTISEQTVEALSADANIIMEATNDISIHSLSSGDGDIDILAFQSTTGSVTFTADADNDGNGTFSLSDIVLQTQGGDLTIEAANIVEQGNSSEIITNGGDISLISSDVFDMRFLFLDSSSSDVGGGNISVEASSNVVLTGRSLNIDSTGGTQAGNVSLTSNAGFVDIGRVDAFSTAGAGGQININAQGNISTGTLTTTGVTAGGDVSLISAAGNIDTDFAIEFPPLNPINTFATGGTGGDVVISASGLIEIGGINTSGSSPSNGGNISLTANEINLSEGLVSTGGTLLLQPFSPSQNIVIGGEFDSDSVTLYITASDLGFITGPFESLTIGRDNGSGFISIDPAGVSFNQTTTLRSPNTEGNIITDGAIQTNGNDLALIAGSSVDVNADITTIGGAIDVTSGPGGIDTTGSTLRSLSLNGSGGDITFNAAGNIITGGQIIAYGTTTGGDINFTSTNGSIDVGNTLVGGALVTNDGIELFTTDTGGEIVLTAAGNISTGEIFSVGEVQDGAISINSGGALNVTGSLGVPANPSEGIGGEIALTAEGNITTSDMSSSGGLGGGSIVLISNTGTISSGDINTSSAVGNGGDLSILAANDLTLNNINTSSGGTGNGGDISASITNGSLTVRQNILSGNGNVDLAASNAVVFENDFESLGNITVTGNSISLHNVSTVGSQTYTGVVDFNSDYLTNGGGFTVNGSSLLLSDTSINTNGGAIAFNGEVNGSNALILMAGNTGNILFNDKVGGINPLSLITATGNSISLHDVSTIGSQTYTGVVDFNSDYLTNGGGFTVNGSSLLLSDTSINTNGGAITFNGDVNGSNNLTLLAGNSSNILFNGDVGVLSRLDLIDIQSANNVTVLGHLLANQMDVVYQGNFTTETPGFLEVDGLFLSPSAQSATLAGIVGGVAGKDTALVVKGPEGDKAFTINGCTIGISCEDLPPSAEPRPTRVNPNNPFSSAGSVLETPPVVSVAQRSSPSDDPNEYQFSNLGNEELWDDNPGGYSVSSFAVFTVSSEEENNNEKKGED